MLTIGSIISWYATWQRRSGRGKAGAEILEQPPAGCDTSHGDGLQWPPAQAWCTHSHSQFPSQQACIGRKLEASMPHTASPALCTQPTETAQARAEQSSATWVGNPTGAKPLPAAQDRGPDALRRVPKSRCKTFRIPPPHLIATNNSTLHSPLVLRLRVLAQLVGCACGSWPSGWALLVGSAAVGGPPDLGRPPTSDLAV